MTENPVVAVPTRVSRVVVLWVKAISATIGCNFSLSWKSIVTPNYPAIQKSSSSINRILIFIAAVIIPAKPGKIV